MQVCSVSIGMRSGGIAKNVLSGLAPRPEVGLDRARSSPASLGCWSLSPAPPATAGWHPAASYVEFIRNIPLLLILFFFLFRSSHAAFSGGPRGWLDILVLDGENTTIVALAIYGGAYLGRGVSRRHPGVGRAFIEAGRSLGLSGLQIARYVTCRSWSARCCLAQQHVHLALQGHRWPWPSPFPS